MPSSRGHDPVGGVMELTYYRRGSYTYGTNILHLTEPTSYTYLPTGGGEGLQLR